MPKPTFPNETPHAGRAALGATAIEDTPLAVHGLDDDVFAADLRRRTTRAIGHWATLIERIDVRFSHATRGRNKARCNMHVVLAGLEPVHVEQAAGDAETAFGLALPRVERALRREFERRDRSAGRESSPDPRAPRLEPAPSLIGRREGRSALARSIARARPEKHRRDLFTDTAEPGVSATDRHAGGGHSARRNTKKSQAGMTVMLEDSLTTPSRKSSRRSANRGKPSTGKERAAVMKSITPRARRARSRSKR